MGELKAGRELDALIAEKVFGLVKCRGRHDEQHDGDYCYAQPDSPMRGGELRSYSSDIADAWLVVEKLRRRGFGFSVGDILNTAWFEVTFDNPVTELSYIVGATTISEAICRAALAAVASSPTYHGEKKVNE